MLLFVTSAAMFPFSSRITTFVIDTDGTVKNFAMNDKCAAGTGRFYEAMANAFEMTLPEFIAWQLISEMFSSANGTLFLP